MIKVFTEAESSEHRRKIRKGVFRPLHLHDHQIADYYTQKRIHEYSHVLLNVSKPGLGKTYVTSKIAIDDFLCGKIVGVIVVCSPTIRNTWEKMMKEYGLPCVFFTEEKSYTFTYDKMSGRAGKKYTFAGLLERKDVTVLNKNGKKKKEVQYLPTPALDDLLRRGVHFIFDEAYAMVNHTSSRHKSARAIFRALRRHIESGGKSRAFSVSATPANTEEQVLDLLHLFGITDTRKPLSRGGKQTLFADFAMSQMMRFIFQLAERGEGHILNPDQFFDEYVDVIDEIGEFPEMNDGVIRDQNFPMKAAEAKDFMYQMFTRCLSQLIMSKSSDPVINGNLFCCNGYYKVSKEEFNRIERSVSALGTAARKQDEGDNSQLGAIQKALVDIETSKKNLFARIVRQKLESNPNLKVVVCLNFLETLFHVADALKEYKPLLIHGDIKDTQRFRNIDLFNENNTNHRLIIFNIATGSRGISLHDTDGRFPRELLISGNYSFEKITQAVYRIYRVGTESDANVSIVFTKGSRKNAILTSLSRKQAVHHEFTQHDELDSEMYYPGNYDDVDF